ncbi:OmpA family protein [Ekhidna lutea]|nr:OmpA family protein [Ekhidna lutea]
MNQLKTIADQYYEAGEFSEAMDFYQHILEMKPGQKQTCFKLAMSAYNSLKYQEAKFHFQELLVDDYFNAEAIYYYGVLLKMESAYQKADSVFQKLLKQIDNQDELYDITKLQKEGCQLGLRQSLTNNNRNFRKMYGINTDGNDFGAIKYTDDQIVLSTSSKTKKKQYLDNQYGGLLPNVVSFDLGDSTVTPNKAFSILNSPWSEATGSFSKDGKAFYFTHCDQNKPCKIVKSLYVDGKWSQAQPLDENINREGFHSKQPSISVTGDTLFFSSDRPGGIGGMDIWMSIKASESEWMVPINMGAAINTHANEITPYYSSAFGGLVFSSNGQAGYGGYDYYLAKGISFYSPQIYNLGPPFNSPFDDTYFHPGFASSNRSGDFDIYTYDFQGEIELLKSFLTEEALIQMVQLVTNSLSLETFRIEDFKSYELFDPTRQLEVVTKSKHLHRNIIGSAEPGSIARLRISNEIEIATLVDKKGEFEFRLLPDTISKFHVKVNQEEVESSVLGLSYFYYEYEFEKIYFDFNSDQLRSESKETLKDLLGQFDIENILLVDIHTHADHIGSAAYNFELSERRGIAAMNELRMLGIPPQQMRVFANGEGNPLSISDSWYSRLFNRRAELRVYTKEPVTFSHPEIFLLKKDISLDKASEILAISPSKLKEWNGLTSQLLKEGHVLRVFDPKHTTPNLRYIIPESDLDKTYLNYIVKQGDTVASIANKFGAIEEIIIEINQIKEALSPGEEIVIYL